MYCLYHETVECILQCMLDTVCQVRETVNDSRPLLRLPIEVLCEIMAHIPTAVYDGLEFRTIKDRSVWRSEYRDTAMILPISQSCKKLRRIALECPSLWTSITTDRASSNYPRIFAERSQGLPLYICLPSISRGKRSTLVLDCFTDDITSRAQDILIGDLPRRDTDNVMRNLLRKPLPVLESLAIRCRDNLETVSAGYACQLHLTKEYAPRLTRLYLSSIDIALTDITASLTHLALRDLDVTNVHIIVNNILSACRCLESLHLEALTDPSQLRPAPELHLPTPSALATLNRLRHAVIKNMHGYLASYFLSLILSDQPELVLQVLHIWTAPIPPVPLPLLQDVANLAIGRYPRLRGGPSYAPFIWGLTASGPKHTLRMTCHTVDFPIDTPHSEVQPLLRDSEMLAGVRELWLVDASCSRKGDTLPVAPDAETLLRFIVADMESLETVVLVEESQAQWARAAPPSLRLLPDGHDPDSCAPFLTTLRIIHGYSSSLDNSARSTGMQCPKGIDDVLDLSVVLDDLASGAYNYLKHLFIEVPRRELVTEEQLEALRSYFSTVQVSVADQAPIMELPDYCTEPYAWPDRRPWPYSCW
ncbi:hypothetical protein OH77DRAFT_631254 [Trametes cingulata]|nr:hypothetical protein OH77DRAFT_631254 [Trametes cingulata]